MQPVSPPARVPPSPIAGGPEPTRSGPTSTTAPTSASALHHALGRGPAAVRVRLSLAAFTFHSFALYDELAMASLKDYVRERLGRPLSSFYDWSRAGRLLATSPRARCACRSGALPYSSAVLLGRRSVEEALDWVAIASGIPTADLQRIFDAAAGNDEGGARREPLPNPPSHIERANSERDGGAPDRTLRVRLRLPRSAASYCDDTLDLARAQLGHHASCADALAAVVAEAATEVDTGSAEVFTPPPCMRVLRASNRDPARPPRARTPWPTPRKPRDRRRLARKLDRILRDCLRALDDYRIRSEELLLELYLGALPPDAGGRNFYQYCEDLLGLKRSTAHDMLVRARLRRREHPLEIARAQHRLCPIKVNLLSRLTRLGVPRSALGPWIDLAARTTVRLLRRLLAAIKRLTHHDLRAWALRGYPPLTEREIRTSETPLSELAQNPDPPDLEFLTQEPTQTLDWEIRAPDHLLLMEMLHHVDAHTRAQRATKRRDRSWWPLMRVFHLARHAWRHAAKAMPRHPHQRVLERDRYTCQVPGCSQRAVEVHHIDFRSHGGTDEVENLLCLCHSHHRHGVHEGRLRIHGRVTEERDELTFDLPFATYQGEVMVSTN